MRTFPLFIGVSIVWKMTTQPPNSREKLEPLLNRRRPENAMRRLETDSVKQENAQINRWLGLAKEMFESDKVSPRPKP